MQNPKVILVGKNVPIWPSNLNTLSETKITPKQDDKHVCHFHTQGGSGEGVTPYNALHTIDGFAWKGYTFFRLQVYEKEEISLVEV